MLKEKLVYRDGKLVPKEKQKPKEIHSVVQDTLLEPIESMATPNREMFDSLSKYKAHLKQHGKEITGGDHLTGYGVHDYKYKANRNEIRDNLLEAGRLNKWGMAPLTEKEKVICRQEMKALNKLKMEGRFRRNRFWKLKKQNMNQMQEV